MALITAIRPITKERYSVHEETECSSFVFISDGKAYLQLDTYGRADRERPGQMSQSFQFTESGARELKKLIAQVFPSIR